MKVKVCYFTHRGRIRDKNEDALLIHKLMVSEEFMEEPECITLTGNNFIFAVADGLGGHEGGEIASKMVLKTLAGLEPISKEELYKALKEAQKKLEEFAREKPFYEGLGTALAGVLLFEDKALVFNVGDCRVYCIEEKAIQLTKDHTHVQELVDMGLLTQEQAKRHPFRNMLSYSLIGSPSFREFEIYMKDVYNCESFLICSDGLWEPLEEHELLLTPIELAELALNKGGQDNITFITIKRLKGDTI